VTAESSAAVTAAVPAWSWPVRAAQFDRSATLSVAERVALDTLGWDVRRWPEHWENSRLRQWQAVHRLVLPLAQEVESLEVVDDWFHHRSARDAVAVILRGCATLGASFWAWDAQTWAGVLGISGNAFLATYPRWARTSA
jgi:hypothetical protein